MYRVGTTLRVLNCKTGAAFKYPDAGEAACKSRRMIYTSSVKPRLGAISELAQTLGLSRPTIYARLASGALIVTADGEIVVAQAAPTGEATSTALTGAAADLLGAQS